MYCCVTDVVTRPLELNNEVRYPVLRKRLLRLMQEDQHVRASDDFFATDLKTAKAITKGEITRIREVIKILSQIKTPSKRNIGLDGSRAIWLIALHNFNYNDAGRTVLKKMKYLYQRDKSQVFYPGIPFLVDRIMVGSKLPFDPEKLPFQLYGTQGFSQTLPNGSVRSTPFPIINKEKLAQRRERFDLKPQSPCSHHP